MEPDGVAGAKMMVRERRARAKKGLWRLKVNDLQEESIYVLYDSLQKSRRDSETQKVGGRGSLFDRRDRPRRAGYDGMGTPIPYVLSNRVGHILPLLNTVDTPLYDWYLGITSSWRSAQARDTSLPQYTNCSVGASQKIDEYSIARVFLYQPQTPLLTI